MKHLITLPLFFALITATLTSNGQSYPLDILPKSSVETVSKKYSFALSDLQFSNRSLKQYKFTQHILINGIVLTGGLLLFENNKIKKLSFGVQEKWRFDNLQKYFSSKYQKADGENTYKFESVTITLIKSGNNQSDIVDYAYLNITYN